MVFYVNGAEFLRLDQSAGRIVAQKGIELSGGEGQMLMYEDSDATLNVVRLWNQETTKTAIMRLGCGATESVIEMQETFATFTQPIRSNTYNSNKNNDVVFQSNGSEYMKFNSTDIAVSQDLSMNSTKGIFTSTISNNISNDLSLYA